MAPFTDENSAVMRLGNPIPLPPSSEELGFDLFVSLGCFEKDEGAHPATSVGPASRPSSSSSQKRKRGPKPKSQTQQARTMPPIQESGPEIDASEAATETVPISSGEFSVQPPLAAAPSRPSAPSVATSDLPQMPPPMPSPSPMSFAGSGGSSAPVTIEMMMALFHHRDEAEARRREERRIEREEERREERRRRDEEMRRREEDDRRRDEENRRRDEQARRRDEMFMKQFQDNQTMMHSIYGLVQRALPPSQPETVPVTLALPVQRAGASQTTSGTPSTSEQPSQPSGQTHPAADPNPGQL